MLDSLFVGSQVLSLSGVSTLVYGITRLDISTILLSLVLIYIGVALYIIVASRVSMKLMLGIVR
jgi:hypothetical protein